MLPFGTFHKLENQKFKLLQLHNKRTIIFFKRVYVCDLLREIGAMLKDSSRFSVAVCLFLGQFECQAQWDSWLSLLYHFLLNVP